MSKPVNNTLVGAFVVGALVLLVAAVMILGSGKIFTKTEKFVLYFDGSVKGLDKGAPVVFQGVKIGSVIDIYMVADPISLRTWIPVIIQIDTRGIKLTSGTPHIREDIALLIRRGLRAKLDIQSPVTAKLMVQLGMYPDTPVRLMNADAVLKGGLPDLPQIPTLPSTFQLLVQALQELDLKGLVKKFNGIMDGLDVIISSPATRQLPELLQNVLAGADRLIGNIDAQIGPLAGDARGAMRDYRALADTAGEKIETLSTDFEKTLAGLDKLVTSLGGEVDHLKPELKKALETLQQVLQNLKGFSGDLKTVAGADSATVYDLQTALKEIADAAQAMRTLADYLIRNPDALLRGRRIGEKKKP